MIEQTIAALNERYGRADRIHFATGPAGYTLAELTSSHAAATLTLEGGQVLAYAPIDQQPVLFLSREAVHKPGKSVRGGIPICWPWFAGERDNPERPFHGFARMLRWNVYETTATAAATTIVLGLQASGVTRRYWPHAFDLQLRVSIGSALHVELFAQNTDVTPYELTAALHSYFQVGDITQVAIHGLEDTQYIDKRDDSRTKSQAGAVTITEATDRIYLATAATCVIDDPAFNRQIVIEKSGSHATVVWNPWAEDARAMADMADDEYRTMVCVETTNAGDNTITLAPGATHTLSATIRTGPRTHA